MYLDFLRQNETLIKECYAQNQAADLNRSKLHSAAIAIQSFWRGFCVRENIKNLNRQAVIIQSNYRGYRQQKKFHILMSETVNKMRINFYDLQSTKIQAIWRGYMSRKTKHDYYKRQKYLQAVALQNSIIIDHLQRFKQNRDEEKRKMDNIQEEQNIIHEARKTHYLLSTRQIQGVYDPRNKNGQRRMPMDDMLRNVRPFTNNERNNLTRKQKLPSIGEKIKSKHFFNDEDRNSNSKKDEEESEYNNYSKSAQFTNQQKIRLENAKKINQPQGPFKRERDAVLEQRFRPLNPSLRVSESYNTGIEEARQNLKFDDYSKKINKNKEFLPVMISTKKEKYQQKLHSTTKYGHIDYGNRHFRAYEQEEKESKKGKGQRFANIVGPIPDFDKYMEERQRTEGVPLFT